MQSNVITDKEREQGFSTRTPESFTGYSDIIKALIPITERLASIFGQEGITASTVRRHAIRLNIIDEHTPTHFLSSVMRQAKLVTNGETRVSTIPSTKGRRQLVYYPDVSSPYAG